MKIGILALVILGIGGITTNNAQTTPSQREDAQEERLKILRAADQIEIVQSNADKLQVEVASVKEQLTKLQEASNAQQQQIDTLLAALQKSEEARAKEREVLLSKVGEMISTATPKTTSVETPKREAIEKESSTTSTTATAEKGYSHIVEKGETLSMIAAAYSEKGVKVTVDDLRKANHLGSKDVLKVGQKLFIPKK